MARGSIQMMLAMQPMVGSISMANGITSESAGCIVTDMLVVTGWDPMVHGIRLMKVAPGRRMQLAGGTKTMDGIQRISTSGLTVFSIGLTSMDIGDKY